MEFETNKSPTQQDIALADVPRMTLKPVTATFSSDLPPMHTRLDSALSVKLDSETESTDATATNQIKGEAAHHRTALFVGITIAVIFSSALAFVYFLR